MLSFLAFTSFLAVARPTRPPVPFSAYAPALAAAPSPERLQGLLQSFVDTGYGVRFRRLGDENDFDHGHLLLDARTGAAVAILYHTQELVGTPADPGERPLSADGRNWLQWLDGRGVVNARRYERSSYPRSGVWDWFVARDLPRLRARGTIVDKMLDPALLGFTPSGSVQWTFDRAPCVGGLPAPGGLRVTLPDGSPVCLTTSLR